MNNGEQHINMKWYGACIVPFFVVCRFVAGECIAAMIRHIWFFNKGKQIILAVGDSAAVYFTTE